ncbi:MAG: UDP-2,3-diacylglucosamine diphosphatase, partial [Beijerinckiaceae bacterium]|nr:UDP-2,3-diacylglucosamine diphosphatase [Beijerinckiaceae bacterium]
MIRPRDEASTYRVRTVFLSDVHLGTRGCQAEALMEFLRAYDADTIYLVG